MRERYTEKVTISDRVTEEKSSITHQGGKLDHKWEKKKTTKKKTFKAEKKVTITIFNIHSSLKAITILPSLLSLLISVMPHNLSLSLGFFLQAHLLKNQYISQHWLALKYCFKHSDNKIKANCLIFRAT